MATRKKKAASRSTAQKKTSRSGATVAKAKKKTARKKVSKKKAKKIEAPKRAEHKPPPAVRKALKKGLELRKEYGGKGLVPNTIAWAQKLAKGAAITPHKARKMHAYFARHAGDKRPGWDDPPTPGYVAWLLWGGDDARAWVDKVLKALDKG